ICSNTFSSFAACCLASFTSRNLPWRKSAISRALRSSVSTIMSSPAFGTSERPWISTGIDGPADGTGFAFSSSIARTRPNTAPVSTISPRLSVPAWTSPVATGLRHDAVVGGDHQHHDVGDLRAPGTHGGEGLVAWRVEEGDDAARRLDVVCADVLRDAAGFTRGHLGAANVVEERRLAVVDVAH